MLFVQNLVCRNVSVENKWSANDPAIFPSTLTAESYLKTRPRAIRFIFVPFFRFQGDAFRCGSCPFLGKPAFEKGQERAIMLADLNSQQDD